MNSDQAEFIWLFNGAGARLPSGAFVKKEQAVLWISQHGLTGILTKYPVNVGVYDWALRMNYFTAKRDEQKAADFIGRFTCASLEHCHFENGIMLTNS
jgi:hypothetical protein